jgi:hypothetical protein
MESKSYLINFYHKVYRTVAQIPLLYQRWRCTAETDVEKEPGQDVLTRPTTPVEIEHTHGEVFVQVHPEEIV